jgi:hypothetical protein
MQNGASAGAPGKIDFKKFEVCAPRGVSATCNRFSLNAKASLSVRTYTGTFNYSYKALLSSTEAPHD